VAETPGTKSLLDPKGTSFAFVRLVRGLGVGLAWIFPTVPCGWILFCEHQLWIEELNGFCLGRGLCSAWWRRWWRWRCELCPFLVAFASKLTLGFAAAFGGCVYIELFKSKVSISSGSILRYVIRSEISAVSAGEEQCRDGKSTQWPGGELAGECCILIKSQKARFDGMAVWQLTGAGVWGKAGSEPFREAGRAQDCSSWMFSPPGRAERSSLRFSLRQPNAAPPCQGCE